MCCRVLDIWVSEVVEAELPQTVFLDDPREMLGNVVRTEQAPHLVDTDIVNVMNAVSLAAGAATGKTWRSNTHALHL